MLKYVDLRWLLFTEQLEMVTTIYTLIIYNIIICITYTNISKKIHIKYKKKIMFNSRS